MRMLGSVAPMSLASQFAALHRPGQPLLMPNPWDAGSAKLLEALGFAALATTSSGFAATLGRLDYSVTREEAIAHAAQIVSAVGVPVSADLENGFGDAPEDAAETVRQAVGAGLAGCSIEDSTGREDDPLYARDHAVERVRAAAEAAGDDLVLTARAENLLHGAGDLADTIARLQAYESAGADVLYAPGLRRIEDVRTVVAAVERPVNVLVLPGGPTVPELAAAGVARVSVGGGFAYAALGGVVEAARELREQGTLGWWERAMVGSKAARAALRPR
jgi:2-methylisocitrate lyase-like PEP mutase family enzyme